MHNMTMHQWWNGVPYGIHILSHCLLQATWPSPLDGSKNVQNDWNLNLHSSMLTMQGWMWIIQCKVMAWLNNFIIHHIHCWLLFKHVWLIQFLCMHQSNKEVWPQIKKHLCLWHIHQTCLKQVCIKSKVTLIHVIVPKMLRHIMYNMDCSDDKEMGIWANCELTKVTNIFF